MSAILTEILDILISGLTTFGQGIGAGLQTIVTSMFIDSTGDAQKLSIFGGVVTIFAAIGLGVGLTRMVYGWLVTLGGRK